jgi:hypothetical protein
MTSAREDRGASYAENSISLSNCCVQDKSEYGAEQPYQEKETASPKKKMQKQVSAAGSSCKGTAGCACSTFTIIARRKSPNGADNGGYDKNNQPDWHSFISFLDKHK